jgi:hypothetical protein
MESPKFDREEDVGFWKNIILISVFFVVTPLTLGISLFSLFSLKSVPVTKNNRSISTNLVISPESGAKVFASLPAESPLVTEDIGSSDARPEIIKQYLKYYDSPLIPYSDTIIQVADKYSIDYRLITAIAQQESNLCKIIPPGSHNCWGWGITGVGTLGFNSYTDAIETVSKGLRENYLDKGYKTIDQIMTKYTPQSNGSWANGVNQFMSEME